MNTILRKVTFVVSIHLSIILHGFRAKYLEVRFSCVVVLVDAKIIVKGVGNEYLANLVWFNLVLFTELVIV